LINYHLLLPEINMLSVNGFLLTGLVDLTWGVYTLKGRGLSSPIREAGAISLEHCLLCGFFL